MQAVSQFIVVFHVVQLLAHSVAGRPRSNETAETTRVSGGQGWFFFLFSKRGGQDATPAGPRNHFKTRPNMTRATIWPTSAQDLRCRGGFVSKTPEKKNTPRVRAPKCRSRCGVASRFVSAMPQQSEICVSVFDTMRKISPKFDAKLHDTFGREKNGEKFTPHFCRVVALTFRGLRFGHHISSG